MRPALSHRSSLASRGFSLTLRAGHSDARCTASEERFAPNGRLAGFQKWKTHGRRMEDTCKTSEKGE